MADIYVDTGDGEIAVSAIDIDDIVRLNSSTYSNLTGSGSTLLWYTGRPATKLLIYAKDTVTSQVHIVEVLACLAGTTPYHVIYGDLATGSNIISITVDYGLVSGTNYLRVYAGPAGASYANATNIRVFGYGIA
jgi:hypothetical protein